MKKIILLFFMALVFIGVISCGSDSGNSTGTSSTFTLSGSNS